MSLCIRNFSTKICTSNAIRWKCWCTRNISDEWFVGVVNGFMLVYDAGLSILMENFGLFSASIWLHSLFLFVTINYKRFLRLSWKKSRIDRISGTRSSMKTRLDLRFSRPAKKMAAIRYFQCVSPGAIICGAVFLDLWCWCLLTMILGANNGGLASSWTLEMIPSGAYFCARIRHSQKANRGGRTNLAYGSLRKDVDAAGLTTKDSSKTTRVQGDSCDHQGGTTRR